MSLHIDAEKLARKIKKLEAKRDARVRKLRETAAARLDLAVKDTLDKCHEAIIALRNDTPNAVLELYEHARHFEREAAE